MVAGCPKGRHFNGFCSGTGCWATCSGSKRRGHNECEGGKIGFFRGGRNCCVELIADAHCCSIVGVADDSDARCA